MTDKTRGFDRRSKAVVPTYRSRAAADAVRDFDLLPEIHGSDELFAIAIGMAEEAARRYGELAGRMATAGHDELAELFRDLESREREHEAGIIGWAQRQGIDVPRRAAAGGHLPETLTEEEVAEAGGDALMTSESALNLAIHSEQRALAFYIRVATEAENEQVRECAEHMASEEVGHVALLRLERRRAARRRSAAGITAPPTFDDANSMAEFVQEHERQSAAQLRMAATGARAADWQRTAARLDTLAGGGSGASSGAVPSTTAVVEIVNGELHRSENVYEAIMHTAEQSSEEALVTAAHEHARVSLWRLAQLKDLHAALSHRIRGPAD